MYCGSKLYYDHFKATNSCFYSEGEIEKLWNSDYVEFLCCFCYSSKLARQILIIKGGDNIRSCCACGKEVKFKDYIKYDGDSMESSVFSWKPQAPKVTFEEKEDIESEWEKAAPKIYCKECYLKRKKEMFYERYGKYINHWYAQLNSKEQRFLKDFMEQTFQILPKLSKYESHTNGFTVKHNHIHTLNLSMMELERIPDSIGNLDRLMILDLSSNKLRELPYSIGELSHLKILNLGYNRLKNLPDSIKNLQILRQLLLPMNNLEELLPEIEWLPHLTYLEISHNPIKEIPRFLENLRNLKIIYCLGFRNRKDISLDVLYELKKDGIILVT